MGFGGWDVGLGRRGTRAGVGFVLMRASRPPVGPSGGVGGWRGVVEGRGPSVGGGEGREIIVTQLLVHFKQTEKLWTLNVHF